jgi:lipid II:glycine glycyltransferase (peptidoglycan interpeptide bridge formation enzyme)
VRHTDDLRCLVEAVQKRATAEHCEYTEIRPISRVDGASLNSRVAQTFYLHRLDLRPGAMELFRRFHHDCIQRKIRRAEREGVEVKTGRSDDFVRTFYGLLLQTRRRQGLPPQPLAWYRNLTALLGESVTIHLAFRGSQAIAGIVTLQHGKHLVYKYGASEPAFHRLGTMPYLLWKVIGRAVDFGLEQLDMGRTDLDNPGLVVFKDRWNAARSLLVYLRSPASRPYSSTDGQWRKMIASHACSVLPDACLIKLGSLFYPHLG